MNSKPTYNWEWYYSKAPFLKIMREECGLKVKRERIYDDCWLPISRYTVELDIWTFKKNFGSIKDRLLNTRICKNNQEIRKTIDDFDDPINALKNVIIQGCISNCRGSIEYVFTRRKDELL